MTNGIVSVVKDGNVLLKAVCGCDGYNAKSLAHLLRIETEVPPLDKVYDFAKSVGFGCNDCLVIQTIDDELYRGEGELHPRYREKFNDPNFNPRWERGICGCVEIVSLR